MTDREHDLAASGKVTKGHDGVGIAGSEPKLAKVATLVAACEGGDGWARGAASIAAEADTQVVDTIVKEGKHRMLGGGVKLQAAIELIGV